jgi:hypothetical protein
LVRRPTCVPALRGFVLLEQFDKEAQSEGINFANRLKELERAELQQRGIEPKP